MAEGDTTILVKPIEPESTLRGVSIRGIIAIMITATGCINVLVSIWKQGAAVPSDFMMFWSGIVGYYFGKVSK